MCADRPASCSRINPSLAAVEIDGANPGAGGAPLVRFYTEYPAGTLPLPIGSPGIWHVFRMVEVRKPHRPMATLIEGVSGDRGRPVLSRLRTWKRVRRSIRGGKEHATIDHCRVLAAVLLTGWAMPSAAQQNGVVIQNNGVDSADSAAGADNVRISNNPGSGASLSGGGLNNETGEAKERNRKDRGARNNAEAAPAEEYAAPAEEYVAPPKATIRPTQRSMSNPSRLSTQASLRSVDATSAETAEHRSRLRELDAPGGRRGSRGPGAGSNESEATSAHIVHASSTDETRGPVT